jgi:hypothetical protein
VAGEGMEVRSAEVILGNRTPLFVDRTSSMAELSGMVPSVLMATCDQALSPVARKNSMKRFFIRVVFRVHFLI